METKSGALGCAATCWLIALLGGVLAAVLLMVLGDWTFIQGVFAGLVIAVIAGALISWLICKPLPAPQNVPAYGAHAAPAAPRETAPTADEKPAATPAAAPAPAAAAAPDGDLVKASTPLAGEAELAARKGSWKYSGTDSAGGAPKASADAAATPDFDGDGVHEGTGEGTRPEALSGPRDGKADNLKEIKGVGPKLEQLCNSLGFYHFDQIANWSAAEVAWVDANLEGFKGRVSRDEWVKQAKILAAGGETEFSKKVEKGGVYD